MLATEQHEEFESRGALVLPNLLPVGTVQSLRAAIDGLQGDAPYNDAGRWSSRNCLPRHHAFADLLINESILRMVVQLLGFNIKLLGSQAVKLKERSKGDLLAVDWHRDGGALGAELPDPLPPAFVKVAFCVSGSGEPDGGELLLVPGSHSHIGKPVFDARTRWPLGSTRVLTRPGDVVIFDWRTWHAVSRNSGDAVRSVLYFTFGFRWLSPMDYQVMPEELLARSPLHRQLLGGASELGYYLPGDAEVPLKALCSSPLRQTARWERGANDPVVSDALGRSKERQTRRKLMTRQKYTRAMVAKAVRDGTT